MADQTLARMFWNRVELTDKPAQQLKQRGAWKTLTWLRSGEVVREISTGSWPSAAAAAQAVGISRPAAPMGAGDFAIFTAGVRHHPDLPDLSPDLIQYIVNERG